MTYKEEVEARINKGEKKHGKKLKDLKGTAEVVEATMEILNLTFSEAMEYLSGT